MNSQDPIWNEWIASDTLTDRNYRKFNRVFLVTSRHTGVKGVCKLLVKNDRNGHLWPLLRREAQLSFEMEGLPRTLAFHETDQNIVLIRSFTEGTPLQEFWKALPQKERLIFLRACIRRLIPVFSILEERGIVHCDIKPANIIVSGTVADPAVSLIDFGMAIFSGEPPERKTLFALGYSAPELILNKLHLLDHTSDIFSLGVSIWQLYTGKLPLMHANPGIMTNLQVTHPLPEHNAVPKGIYKVLQQMCVKHSFKKPPHHLDPLETDRLLKSAMERRFQNLQQVSDALEGLTADSGWLKRIFG